MKNIILFTIFSVIFWGACTNDVTSIGQDLIYDEGYVELITHPITQTSTVKLDSFSTSTGYNSALTKLILGTVQDPFTGRTTATPYFEILPSGGTRITGDTYVYDSVTFNFSYGGSFWGDSLSIQTYYLYQLENTPRLDPETDLIYNNYSVEHHATPLGTFRLLPIASNFNKLHFRLDDNLGRTLFNKVKVDAEEIRDDAVFINYFKGLVLVPDPNNTCVMAISAKTDSLGIKLHFSNASKNYTYSFNKSSSYNRYTFMNIENNAAGTPYDVLKNQLMNLPFQDVIWGDAVFGQTVTQGLSGYMIKMRLPIAPAGDKYKTIVKAEIELHPQQNSNRQFPFPPTLQIYKSDESNRALSVMTNAAGYAVTGTLYRDNVSSENDKYIINITDYYNNLCQQIDASRKNELVISVPLSEMNATLNRLVIDRVPTLNVYYAKYE